MRSLRVSSWQRQGSPNPGWQLGPWNRPGQGPRDQGHRHLVGTVPLWGDPFVRVSRTGYSLDQSKTTQCCCPRLRHLHKMQPQARKNTRAHAHEWAPELCWWGWERCALSRCHLSESIITALLNLESASIVLARGSWPSAEIPLVLFPPRKNFTQI